MYNGTSSYTSPYNPPAPEYGEPPTFMDSALPSIYDEMPGLAVTSTASSPELALQEYTAFPTTLNAQAYLFTPDLESSNPNELYYDGLQSGYISHNLPEDIAQPLNGIRPTHDECPAWQQHASSSIDPHYPGMEYPSSPTSTFASPDSASLGHQTTASLDVRSMHQDPELIRILDGTINRRMPHSAKYKRDLCMSKDKRFRQVVDTIIQIMAKVEVPRDGSIPQTRTLINEEIHQYLLQQFRGSDSDTELQDWIQLIWNRKLKMDGRISTPAAKDKALSRRDDKKNKDRTLSICCWCEETFTTEYGLGNHVRSHLEFHLWFCDHCDFSAVHKSRSGRHLQRKHGLQRDSKKRVPRREKPHNNSASPYL